MSHWSAVSSLAVSAGLMGISNLCLKAAIGRTQPAGVLVPALVRQPMFWCGFLLFAICSLIYIRVLTSISLSTAYPVFVSIAFAVVAVGAMMLFEERLTMPKLLGSAFLIAGIALIARG
jgi:multidrug transporter EmrE-like cation transporter